MHAAIKQKYQILDSPLELSYLEPLFHGSENDDPSVSKLTAIHSICCGLHNLEHPGFPVTFLPEDQKVLKAQQILKNLNTENFLQHIDLDGLGQWYDVDVEELHDQFNFPRLNPENFSQIFEVTSSVHALTKGKTVGSHLRKNEVDDMRDLQDFSEYKELLKLPPESLKIKYMSLNDAPADYIEKMNSGILPPWPGPGTLYRLNCAPSNRTDITRGNWKQPTIYILDDNNVNPLNCSDVFKTVGAVHCFQCPSVMGSLGGCSHIGFMLIHLSAPFVYESTNKPVRLVNIRNKHTFLHPEGVTDPIVDNVPISTSKVRHSLDTRQKSTIYYPGDNLVPDNGSDFSISSGVRTIPDNVTSHNQENQLIVGETYSGGETDVAAGRSQDQENSQFSSQCSTTQSLYGYSTSNINALISRSVRRNPSRAIPNVTSMQGDK